jgi:hypothetical protein
MSWTDATAEMPTFLTPAHLESYRTEGYIVLPAVYTPEECAAMSAAANRAAATVSEARGGVSMGGGWGGEWRKDLVVGADAANSQLLSIHDMQFHDAAFASVLLDRRLSEPTADPRPQLFTFSRCQVSIWPILRIAANLPPAAEPCADLIGPDIQLHHVKYHEKPPEFGA